MAAQTAVGRRVVAVVGGCLVLALAVQMLLEISPVSADDANPPTSPVNCVVDRIPFAPTALVTWEHDGENVEKYIVEKSRNGGEFTWDGAPLAPVTEHLVTDLPELDVFDVRVSTKAPDGTLSDHAPCAAVPNVPPPIEITVDPTRFVTRPDDVIGLGLGINWLLDSDLHRPRTRSNVEAIDDLGARILRFPFGHLSDNYLWNIPPWNQELQPRIASQFETPGLQAQGNRDWSWAVDPDGSLIDAMDFDEFIDMSVQLDAATVVVVNAAAHEYESGPSYETLRETAVEWVRYAMENSLEVDHWQIGNEADHPSDAVLTSSEYSALYLDFAAAMRAVDPSISIGPGLIGLSPYSDEVIAAIEGDMNFAGVHQYLHFRDHDDWRRSLDDPVPNITNIQRLVSESAAPGLPILVTETSSLGQRWLNGDAVTTTKALALFEMLVRQHSTPNVVASLLWTTHTPWSGENFIGDDSNMFTNDDLNALTPNGMAAQLFADTMDTAQLLESPPRQGNIEAWPSIDAETGAVVVHLLNKGTVGQEITVAIDDRFITTAAERIVFSGEGPDDAAPTRTSDVAFAIENGTLSTVVPATSIVVLELEFIEAPQVAINEIHYNPADDGPEFVELVNLEPEPVDLAGFSLDGLLTFPPGTIIQPDGFVVVTNDLVAFNDLHPNIAAIEWDGGQDLDDDGELIELVTGEGLLVDRVDYR